MYGYNWLHVSFIRTCGYESAFDPFVASLVIPLCWELSHRWLISNRSEFSLNPGVSRMRTQTDPLLCAHWRCEYLQHPDVRHFGGFCCKLCFQWQQKPKRKQRHGKKLGGESWRWLGFRGCHEEVVIQTWVLSYVTTPNLLGYDRYEWRNPNTPDHLPEGRPNFPAVSSAFIGMAV